MRAHDRAARHLPQQPGRSAPRGTGWPIVASCALLLAGAVTLVLMHQAGVTFLILFSSCTLVTSLAIARPGRGRGP